MKKTLFACGMLAAFLLILSAPPGCYYDNEEELYGRDTTTCDTAGITYNNYIRPLMEAECFKCHQPGHPSGTYSGFPFETYAKVKVIANSINGKLVTRTNDALAPMPQPGFLPDCDREKIKAWVLRGAPEN